MGEVGARKAKSLAWRPWMRAVHRDAGYVVVGLTFIYALSGIAVNHLTDSLSFTAQNRSSQSTKETSADTPADASVNAGRGSGTST